MSVELIKYAFVAGEVSPTLFGRTDLEKYELGLAKCHNFFVDYKGGISTRPGTIFLDYIMKDDKLVKLVPFQFDTDIEDTYLLMFGHFYVRFLQFGAYVEEVAKSITAVTQANPGRATSVAHGFEDGDWVRLYEMNGMTPLNERIVEVTGKTADQFYLHDEYSNPIDTTQLGPLVAGTPKARRIYTLSTPYSQFDLEKLRANQIRDLIRLTHPEFKTRNLIRFAADDWVLIEENLRPRGDISLDFFAGNLVPGMTLEQMIKFLKRLGAW